MRFKHSVFFSFINPWRALVCCMFFSSCLNYHLTQAWENTPGGVYEKPKLKIDSDGFKHKEEFTAFTLSGLAVDSTFFYDGFPITYHQIWVACFTLNNESVKPIKAYQFNKGRTDGSWQLTIKEVFDEVPSPTLDQERTGKLLNVFKSGEWYHLSFHPNPRNEGYLVRFNESGQATVLKRELPHKFFVNPCTTL